MKSVIAAISLHKETKDMPRKLEAKGQTCEEVIKELIEQTSSNELDGTVE